MGETLKEIVENQWKLHRLDMINCLLYQTYHYVNDIYEKIQDDFYDQGLEDCIIENIIKTTKDNLDMLQKFL